KGAIDFTFAWETDAVASPEETLSLELNQLHAEASAVLETISLEVNFGMLGGRIVDTPAANSRIAATVSADGNLYDGAPILVNMLDALEPGVDFGVDIDCDLNGVLYYETTLGGVRLPGDLRLNLGWAE